MRIPLFTGKKPIATNTYSLIVLLLLLLGMVYYVVFRADSLPWVFNPLHGLHEWYIVRWLQSGLFLFVNRDFQGASLLDSVPSFLHALIAVLVVNLLYRGSASLARWSWLGAMSALLVCCEVFTGWFSWLDMLALLAGFAVAQLCVLYFPPDPCVRVFTTVSTRLKLCAAIAGTSLLTMGSYPGYDYFSGECARYDEQGFCEEYKRRGVPVYMSYARLRNAVAVQEARPPDRIGRVYLYQDYVFLNERNQGIHIIDNQNPSSPVNVGFIRVPGNTEIAIRGNYLYADSYIDLVTLDLNDPANIRLVGRQESIFPYDEFQNIPNNISFSSADTDPSYGVVVSYRLSE